MLLTFLDELEASSFLGEVGVFEFFDFPSSPVSATAISGRFCLDVLGTGSDSGSGSWDCGIGGLFSTGDERSSNFAGSAEALEEGSSLKRFPRFKTWSHR